MHFDGVLHRDVYKTSEKRKGGKRRESIVKDGVKITTGEQVRLLLSAISTWNLF